MPRSAIYKVSEGDPRHFPRISFESVVSTKAPVTENHPCNKMVVVSLGDDVRTVRSKIGLGENDYTSSWRLLNVRMISGV